MQWTMLGGEDVIRPECENRCGSVGRFGALILGDYVQSSYRSIRARRSEFGVAFGPVILLGAFILRANQKTRSARGNCRTRRIRRIAHVIETISTTTVNSIAERSPRLKNSADGLSDGCNPFCDSCASTRNTAVFSSPWSSMGAMNPHARARARLGESITAC